MPDLLPHVEGVLGIEWQNLRDPPPNSPDPHQEGRAAPELYEPFQGVAAPRGPEGGAHTREEEERSGARRGGGGGSGCPGGRGGPRPPGFPPAPTWYAEA